MVTKNEAPARAAHGAGNVEKRRGFLAFLAYQFTGFFIPRQVMDEDDDAYWRGLREGRQGAWEDGFKCGRQYERWLMEREGVNR